MKVTSFGCSFIFGNDLSDDGRNQDWATPSQLTWPALIAQRIGADYRCHAKGGVGNLYILSRMLYHLNQVQDLEQLYVIGWTWGDRFDYQTASDVNAKDPWSVVCPISRSPEADFYYRNFHSEAKDKLTSLIHMHSAIAALKHRGIRFVMTCMDDIVFDRKWHSTGDITLLQDLVSPHITKFDNQNFLDWSRSKGFKISSTLHPLEQAHESAADYMMPVIESILRRA